MQLIGLLDCNNFFVSCERLFRPDLQSTPVVVLSGNDGCVVARSNEVKALGIPMGVPYFQVKAELTQAQVAVFSSNFTLYRDISARVMQALKTEVVALEVYSVDEAFFSLTASSVQAAEIEAVRIKQVIERQIGVPVSIGVANSKTIAKYASEVAKQKAKTQGGPGVACITGADWVAAQAGIAVQEIWGIGSGMSASLRQHDMHTVADFLAANRSQIISIFGVLGARLYDELSEQAVWSIGGRAKGTQKSHMSTRSFAHTTSSKPVVFDAIAYHVGQVAADMRADGMAASTLQVLAKPSRHSDWVLYPGTAVVTLDVPTNDTRLLLTYARELLDIFFDDAVPYKKAGVIVSGLVPTEHIQPTLFAGDTKVTPDPMMAVMDGLNARFGTHTVTVGGQRQAAAWQPKTDWLSPQYTTKWSDIASVEA